MLKSDYHDSVSTSPQAQRSQTSSKLVICDAMTEHVTKLTLTESLWSLSDISSSLSETSPVKNVSQTALITETDHWSENECENIKGRISMLFMNDFMSDITFVCVSSCDPTKNLDIPAHKFVLAASSTVFYAMFYGTLAESDAKIHISDIESDVFTELLRYLYCDHFVSDNLQTLLGLLYASNKYLLKHLFQECTLRLAEHLNAENAVVILENALLFDVNDLVNEAFELIDAQTNLCLTSKHMFDVSLSTINIILNRETLSTSEVSSQINLLFFFFFFRPFFNAKSMFWEVFLCPKFVQNFLYIFFFILFCNLLFHYPLFF